MITVVAALIEQNGRLLILPAPPHGHICAEVGIPLGECKE